MLEWSNSLLPENQIVIAISSFDNKHVHWICIGKVDSDFRSLSEHDYRTNVKTTVGVGVHSIKWWHPIPDLPFKDEDGEWWANEEWIPISDSLPPQRRGDPFQFIVFDEFDGIAECEYWGGFQSDTWSCKHYFSKPLFWRPFPVLPIKSYGIVLQC